MTTEIAVAGAVLVGLTVLLATARGAGIPIARAVALVALLAVAALAGGKLYALVEQRGFAYVTWSNLFDGFRYPGTLVGVLLGLGVARRLLVPTVSLGALGDWLAPAMGFAEVAGRIGCFLNGCCFGVVSYLPWAVRYAPGTPAHLFHVGQGWTAETAPSLPVHPLQLYFALWALALGVLCLRLRSREYPAGTVLLAFIALHELGKFLLELLRAPVDPAAGFYLRVASLILAALALALLTGRTARGTWPVPARDQAGADRSGSRYSRSRRRDSWDS
jgi:phosphatidylglycerol:prolipoprotein diacylglycerol transferase